MPTDRQGCSLPKTGSYNQSKVPDCTFGTFPLRIVAPQTRKAMIDHKPFPKLLAVSVAAGLVLSCSLSWSIPASGLSRQTYAGANAKGKLNCQPANLKFHEVPLGQNKTLPAVLRNLGTAALTISQLKNNAPSYSISGITIPFTLGAGQSVNIGVTFTPSNLGQTNGNFAFISNASNSPYYLYVYGRGASGGVLTANPASIDFGAVQVGKNKSNYETLTNTGTARLTISQANVSGSGFSLSGLNLPLALDPSQNFTFSVTFTPPSSGTFSGTIGLVSDAADPNLSIPLSGQGTPAGTLAASPAGLDFGVVTTGTSKSLPATLTATGATVTVTSDGTSNPEFTVSGLSFPLTIPDGQSQPYTVTYTPQDSGNSTGVATFVSDASNSPTTQSLTGNGTAPPHHNVDLSWNTSRDAVGYNVYRGGVSGGPYSKINTAPQAGTEYEDDLVSPGQTYYYVATAVGGNGEESVYSNEAQALIPSP